MKDILRRCLALVLVMSLVLSTGVMSAFATGSEGNAAVLDVDNAIIAKPDADQELIQNTLEDAMNEITGFDANENVVFIVELEGKTLLDTKPAKQTVSEYMASEAGASAVKAIALQQAAVQSLIANAGKDLQVDYTYQVVLNGLAVRGTYADRGYLESLAGVASVTVAKTYTYEEPVDGYTAANQTSGAMMDSDSANAAGYTGKGTVTAILDTGLDLTHSAFVNDPEEPALDLADIEAAVATGNLNAVVTADQLYKSAKIPFAYDYTSDDADVDDPNSHGTHVAGTVGADCAEFTGVAPDTQIVAMKVFNDEGSGATDAVIFAALEDAVVLGVDAINMSLGTPGGFTAEDEVTDAVYNAVRDAGINLMVSAGNENSATYNNNIGTSLPLVSEPDNGIVGSPSTYAAALSVASVNEYQDYITYIQSGENRICFNDANMETSLDFVKTFDGQTMDYVYVAGFGTADDFAAVDVAGKIALVVRGELAFTDKEANAAAAGAVGLMVFDNTEGDLIYMASNGDIPAIFISKADGLILRDQETKTISVSADFNMFTDTADGGLMSDFSSLGVAPDLTLKPEITAPGGYVFSTLPGNTYGSMSGTSMASPHMAGAAAVVQQYVNGAFASLTDGEKQSLINTLLMNTADPVEDENGVAYTPRKQGAGLAQVNSAINTGAYVTVDGTSRPKAELGDSPDGTFSKTVTLTVHNISDEALTYNMSAIALTAMEETVNVGGIVYNCISEHARVMPESELAVSFSADTVTVAAGSTASVTVNLTLTDAGEEGLANFVNGTFLDGYIVLESADDGIDLSVPYLGFYGDWGQASVYDDTIYEDETASTYASAVALLDLSTGNGYYLGSNFYTDGDSFNADKIAVSREMLADGYRPFTLLGLLRAPKTLTYTVTDASGNPVELIDEVTLESLGTSYTVDNVIKSFYYSNGGYINYEMGPLNYGWNAIEDLGDGFYSWLLDGQYYINATAQVDGTDSAAGTQTTTFPITIDSQAPQLVGHDFEEVDGVPYVTLDVYDENYVMAFQIVSADGMSAFSPAIPVDEAEAGTTTSYTFDTSALLEAGYTSACIYIYDYALNGYTSYEFSLESDNLQPAAVHINNQGMSVSGAQTFEIEAWIEPEGLEAAEKALTWTSSDENIATVRDTGETRYDEDSNVTFYIAEVTTHDVGGTATITVSTVNGKTDSTTVTVVSEYSALPDDFVIREDGVYKLPADLNTQVVITDNARNVTIVGSETNTAEAPYQDLSLKSEITEGLNLTIRDLNVTSTVYSSWGTPAAAPTITFTGTGNTLNVQGENTFVGVSYGSLALIQVDNGTELTVDGTGTLNLYQPGNTNGAALGSQAGYPCGTIVIEGGTLNVTTEGYGAGIGGGAGANAPSITINGGTVNADSRYATAGYSTNESYAGAAIGAGNGAYGGTNKITINGGSVTATTSTNSAAIGGALYSSYSQGSDANTIVINGGKVVASSLNKGGTPNSGGAAIGSSSNGGTASITVNGGEVVAMTTTSAAAIGGGYKAKAPTIYVTGGTVSALAGSTNSSSAYRGPAIGKGAYGTAGYAYIDGGAVLAAGNADANFAASVYNSDYEALVEVALTIPGIESLSIDGVDWKVSANHADFTEAGGSDYTDKVYVWLPEALSTPYTVVAETENGTEQFGLYTNGNIVGIYDVTYTQVSLSLAGDIGVNYYVQLSDDIVADEGAYMRFTVAGQTQTVPLSEAEVSTDDSGVTTYRFTCKVAAKQMTEEITGQMYLSDGTAVGEEKIYSVKAYCDAAIPAYSQNAEYADLVGLMEAMLNYGGYAQVQFGYNTDNLANAGLDLALPELTADDVAAYAHGATGSEEGISVASVSLLLESTTTIRFYFELDGSKSIDEYTFCVDGVETTPVAGENGQYYVDKVNVAAKDLDEMVTVTVGGLTARYCGLSYVRQVAVLYPTYYSEALVNVAKALYAYNQAANAYFA